METKRTENKPGLALFTIITYDFEFAHRYTYITALPYRGKLKKYIDEIDGLTDFFIGLCADASGNFEIFVETFDFDSFVEAKAAARGATLMDVEENAGLAVASDGLDAESLQQIIKDMKNIIDKVKADPDLQEPRENEKNQRKAQEVIREVAQVTNLWAGP